jgi:hypothetical protein
VNRDAYVGTVLKLLRAGNAERAHKLALAAGDTVIPKVVEAMLAAAESMPYEQDVLIRIALKEAFEAARARELGRVRWVGWALAGSAVPCGLGAWLAYAEAGSAGVTTIAFASLGLLAVLAGAIALRQLGSLTLDELGPLVEALVDVRLKRSG